MKIQDKQGNLKYMVLEIDIDTIVLEQINVVEVEINESIQSELKI